MAERRLGRTAGGRPVLGRRVGGARAGLPQRSRPLSQPAASGSCSSGDLAAASESLRLRSSPSRARALCGPAARCLRGPGPGRSRLPPTRCRPSIRVPAQQPKRRGWIVASGRRADGRSSWGWPPSGRAPRSFTSSHGGLRPTSRPPGPTRLPETPWASSTSAAPSSTTAPPQAPRGLKASWTRAEQNPHIKAVVLRVNSGGGVATAGEEMSTYIRDFSKPVVVSSASINASAAYDDLVPGRLHLHGQDDLHRLHRRHHVW